MAKIDKYCAVGVYDPPGYSQGIRVTAAQTILFLAGQGAYDKDGGGKHRGDFTRQARDGFAAGKALGGGGGGTRGKVGKIKTDLPGAGDRPAVPAGRAGVFGS